jgi:uncharacterized protein YabN with tetrapyrrole methylase and pyrophosphatase domain
LLDLVRVMARLRGPGGCPWDHEQTHRTLARHLLEETHEVLDAIDAGDPDRLRDELGDVLLQVVFHAQMAAEEGTFDVDDVAHAIVEKLIRRHPHVFGEVHVSGADEVLVNWEQIKAEETGEQPVEDDIPPTLPAMAKLREEVEELAAAGTPEEAEEELGDVLFAAAAVARRLGVDPESALRRTTTKFAGRYERLLARARREGVDLAELGEDELLAYYRQG